MTCLPTNQAVRRYTRRMLSTMVFYTVSLLLAVSSRSSLHHRPLLTGLLAVITAMPIVAVIAIVGLYLKEEKDEFQRELLTQNILWAVALTFTVTSTWGLLEWFAPVPPLPAFYVFVLFWILFGALSVPLRMRYRMGPNE